jgi:hypothetical protein
MPQHSFCIDPDRCRRNLWRSAELLTLCCTLQEAYLRTRFPDATAADLRRRVWQNIIAAKEQAWTPARP